MKASVSKTTQTYRSHRSPVRKSLYLFRQAPRSLGIIALDVRIPDIEYVIQIERFKIERLLEGGIAIQSRVGLTGFPYDIIGISGLRCP